MAAMAGRPTARPARRPTTPRWPRPSATRTRGRGCDVRRGCQSRPRPTAYRAATALRLRAGGARRRRRCWPSWPRAAWCASVDPAPEVTDGSTGRCSRRRCPSRRTSSRPLPDDLASSEAAICGGSVILNLVRRGGKPARQSVALRAVPLGAEAAPGQRQGTERQRGQRLTERQEVRLRRRARVPTPGGAGQPASRPGVGGTILARGIGARPSVPNAADSSRRVEPGLVRRWPRAPATSHGAAAAARPRRRTSSRTPSASPASPTQPAPLRRPRGPTRPSRRSGRGPAAGVARRPGRVRTRPTRRCRCCGASWAAPRCSRSPTPRAACTRPPPPCWPRRPSAACAAAACSPGTTTSCAARSACGPAAPGTPGRSGTWSPTWPRSRTRTATS